MIYVERSFIFLVIICITIFGGVENRSLYGIGTRIIGDQLIVKDILQSHKGSTYTGPVAIFNYNVPEPITCIEIFSEENVLADVKFSYQDELVKGSVTAVNVSASHFEAVIKIYGFAQTMLNVNPALIINRDQQFMGILEPIDYENEFNITEEELNDLDYSGLSEEGQYSFEKDIDNSLEEDTDDFSRALDEIIELGQRHEGDYLLYETYQTSPSLDDQPGNHSVTFYYIDRNFITYVRFTLYEYFGNKELPDSQWPMAVYTHYSPTTLKAVISDTNTKLLFVQMRMYGFAPEDLPKTYTPYLTTRNNLGFMPTVTKSPLSPLQRLKAVLNSGQQENSDLLMTENQDMQQQQQQQQQQQYEAMKVEKSKCESAASNLGSHSLAPLIVLFFIRKVSIQL